MKILLLAEACNPEWTSVPLVGFNTVQALSERRDLDIVLATHIRNREALQRREISNRIEIAYINNEWLAKPLYHMGRMLRGGGSLGWTTNMAVNWPAYIAFEKQLGRRFSKRLRSGEFDLIHRVTPVSPTLPSPLASMTDVPMVIGPLNGGLPWPKQFPSLHKNEREWLSPIRNIYQRLPWYKSSYRRLTAVISGSRHTATEVPDCFNGQRFYLPENGIDPKRFEIASGWTAPTKDFQFITVGRLVPYKGFDMVLQAMSESPVLKACKLLIVGDGPERQNLEELSSRLQLTERVKFAGWLPQSALSVELRNSQAFVFPSLREFGGGVVLEAMASGLPSIVMNYGGPAELIDEYTGILLEMAPREQIIEQLILAMEKLAMNEGLSRSLAENAIRKVHLRFTWDRKADQLRTIYGTILRPPRRARRRDEDDTIELTPGPFDELPFDANVLSQRSTAVLTESVLGHS